MRDFVERLPLLEGQWVRDGVHESDSRLLSLESGKVGLDLIVLVDLCLDIIVNAYKFLDPISVW